MCISGICIMHHASCNMQQDANVRLRIVNMLNILKISKWLQTNENIFIFFKRFIWLRIKFDIYHWHIIRQFFFFSPKANLQIILEWCMYMYTCVRAHAHTHICIHNHIHSLKSYWPLDKSLCSYLQMPYLKMCWCHCYLHTACIYLFIYF